MYMYSFGVDDILRTDNTGRRRSTAGVLGVLCFSSDQAPAVLELYSEM